MNKTIVITMLMLVISVVSASAYHYGSSGYLYNHNTNPGLMTSHIPMENPHYSNYVDNYHFLRQDKFRKSIHRFSYQNSISPYLIVRSPYGKKPWNKPYGDNHPNSLVENDWNPFFGFPYVRTYNCHSQFACHYHNRFPGN